MRAKSHEDRRIGELAARQHGVVARFQLLEMGLRRRQIGHRMELGRLHRIRQGVYAVGHRRLTPSARFMAAVLAGGSDAVLSHLSAAAHYGIRQDNRPTIDVTVPRALHKRPGITWHRSSLPKDETTSEDGIPITTVPRTLFDLGAAKGPPALERAIHEAEVRRLTDPLTLSDIANRYPYRPGAAAARKVLGKRERPAVTANDFEEDFHAFLIARNLPIPAFNKPIHTAGRWLKPDCTWPVERLLAELDGREVHDTTNAYDNDRERDRILMIEGWRTTRITWKHLYREPDKLERELRALLGA